MRLIGDVHGKMYDYELLTREVERSVQLGDMNFSYEGLADISMNHRFIKGNHDGYNVTDPHELGDFGIYSAGGFEMFFVRGALSIDKHWRKVGYDWFPEEELTYPRCVEAIELYGQIKPNIVISHDCPLEICTKLFGYDDRPITRQCLQVMLEIHQPELWIFGHHHKSRNEVVDGTNFICLRELETFDL